jgi:hypothetical protein
VKCSICNQVICSSGIRKDARGDEFTLGDTEFSARGADFRVEEEREGNRLIACKSALRVESRCRRRRLPQSRSERAQGIEPNSLQLELAGAEKAQR